MVYATHKNSDFGDGLLWAYHIILWLQDAAGLKYGSAKAVAPVADKRGFSSCGGAAWGFVKTSLISMRLGGRIIHYPLVI